MCVCVWLCGGGGGKRGVHVSAAMYVWVRERERGKNLTDLLRERLRNKINRSCKTTQKECECIVPVIE